MRKPVRILIVRPRDAARDEEVTRAVGRVLSALRELPRDGSVRVSVTRAENLETYVTRRFLLSKYETLLFWTYVLFLSVSLFKKHHLLANYIFNGAVLTVVVVSLALLPALRLTRQSLINISVAVQRTANRVPVILWMATIYLLTLTISSFLPRSVSMYGNRVIRSEPRTRIIACEILAAHQNPNKSILSPPPASTVAQM
jgi:hypothetical protein